MHYQLPSEAHLVARILGRPITSLLSSLIMQLLGPPKRLVMKRITGILPDQTLFEEKVGVCSNTWNTLYIIDTFTQIMSRCSFSNPFLSFLDYFSTYFTPILEKSLSHWRQVFFLANWFNHHQPAFICWTHVFRWCWLRSNASRTWILHWLMPLMRQRRRWARCDFGIALAVWNLSFFWWPLKWRCSFKKDPLYLCYYWVCIFVERCTSICIMNVFRYQKNTHSIKTLLWHCKKVSGEPLYNTAASS